MVRITTIFVDAITSSLEGNTTFFNSIFTSLKKSFILANTGPSSYFVNAKMAGQEGFEPPTLGFGVRRSSR
jgi:hypothetical protein